MKNRPADVLYNGVNADKIKSASPVLNEINFKYLFQFISRRYRVHKKKDVDKTLAPWTKDAILREFKFTNVRREHDRESIWLIKNIAENNQLSYGDKLLNIMLFRMFNKSDTTRIIGLVTFSTIDFLKPHIEDRLKRRAVESPDYVFFTNAFITGGLKLALGNSPLTFDEFMPMRIIKFIEFLYKDGITDKIQKCKTQKDVYNVIKSYNGLGEFLSYQIFVDFTYIPEFPFSENEFVISGPGCILGLNYIFQDRDGMSYDECLFWLRDNLDALFLERGFNWNPIKLYNDLPRYDRSTNVMSLENCHCELSKYIRAVEGTGRPRNKYKPR